MNFILRFYSYLLTTYRLVDLFQMTNCREPLIVIIEFIPLGSLFYHSDKDF